MRAARHLIARRERARVADGKQASMSRGIFQQAHCQAPSCPQKKCTGQKLQTTTMRGSRSEGNLEGNVREEVLSVNRALRGTPGGSADPMRAASPLQPGLRRAQIGAQGGSRSPQGCTSLLSRSATATPPVQKGRSWPHDPLEVSFLEKRVNARMRSGCVGPIY